MVHSPKFDNDVRFIVSSVIDIIPFFVRAVKPVLWRAVWTMHMKRSIHASGCSLAKNATGYIYRERIPSISSPISSTGTFLHAPWRYTVKG